MKSTTRIFEVEPERQKRKHISWSQLAMFTRCGEQYRRRYILGEKRPPNRAMLVGRATHASIEANMTSRLPGNHWMREDEALAKAAYSLNGAWDEAGEVSDCTPETSVSARGQDVDLAVSLARLHFQVLAPRIEPAYVERPWRIEVVGAGIDVIGYIDLQEQCGRIRDTKTVGQSPSADKADKADQLTMYALASKALDGGIPELSLDSLVKLKRGPKAVCQATKRTQADLDVLLRRMQVMLNALDAGIFPPASREDWVCSRKWCGYYDTCPYVNGRVITSG